MRADVPNATWQGDLAAKAMAACIDILKDAGVLPAGYQLRSSCSLPMWLDRPTHQLVARDEEAEELRSGLMDVAGSHAVLLWGGPGEGKSELARSVGLALYNQGHLSGGAFQVDMTGVRC
jgi:hypothetical protein